MSFAIVKDIAKPGAFDAAVQDIHGIIHTAAPFQVFGVEDNKRDLLKPAIDGTLNILKSAQELAPQVKRIVLASSFAAMIDPTKGSWPGHVYSELDWNLIPYETAAAPGAPGGLAYSTTKALAERVARDFVKTCRLPFLTSRTACLSEPQALAKYLAMFTRSIPRNRRGF